MVFVHPSSFTLVILVLVKTTIPATADSHHPEWPVFQRYQVDYDRTYGGSEEEEHRFEAFLSTLREIEDLRHTQPNAIYELNEFSDHQREKLTCGISKRTRTHGRKPVDSAPIKKINTYWDGRCMSCARFPELAKGLPIDPVTKLPGWDWTQHGAVTDVKSQGGCGGCWAFGATGDVEGAHFLAGNDLISLSQQQLLECDHEGSDDGCGGSVSDLDSLEYVVKNGLTSLANYPFTSANNTVGKCKMEKVEQVQAKISHQWQISGIGHLNDTYPGNNETFPGNSPWNVSVPVDEQRVLEALVRLGPLAIAIQAVGMGSYKGGVICPEDIGGCPLYCCYPPGNSYSTLDHEVLLVGFGTEIKTHGNIDYWKIKNSWGNKWGEGGYFRVRRGLNAMGVNCNVIHSVV